jgi:hypothetical protein
VFGAYIAYNVLNDANVCILRRPPSTMSEFSPQRQLAPGPSGLPLRESPPGDGLRHPMDPAKKRVSMACLACKKSKRKVHFLPGGVGIELLRESVLRNGALRQLSLLQPSMHLRRNAGPTPARRGQTHRRRAQLPPRHAQ